MKRYTRSVFFMAFVVFMCMTTVAYAAVYLYVTGAASSRGVGRARLNMNDNTAASRIGIARTAGPVRDRNYRGRAVYIWSFGRRLSDGRYPVRMYAYDNANDNVFHFTINSRSYKTPSGVCVGCSGSTVKSKYPSCSVIRGSVYTIYRIKYSGGKPYTDFVVKSGKVHHINIYK